MAGPHTMTAPEALACMVQEDYDAAQLDILAIAFTCMKVLYIGGAIQRARKLMDWLEPARRAFRTPMHQTVIRNEAAFYGCIQQLIEHAPPQLPCHFQQDQPVMYLCGDSHCLPGGNLSLQLVTAAPVIFSDVSTHSLELRHWFIADYMRQERIIHLSYLQRNR